jgi:predicted kinase
MKNAEGPTESITSDSCPACDMPYDENNRCPNPRCDYMREEETDRRRISPSSEDPLVIVLCGLPGVGKSTVVSKLKKSVGGTVFRTDRIRKRIFDEPEYTKEETEAVYDDMMQKAEDVISNGGTVILDGTFKTLKLRDKARKTAERQNSDFRLIKVECNTGVVKDRIENRSGISDADFSTHKKLSEEFESISEGEVIDNSGDLSAVVRQVAFVTPPSQD